MGSTVDDPSTATVPLAPDSEPEPSEPASPPPQAARAKSKDCCTREECQAVGSAVHFVTPEYVCMMMLTPEKLGAAK